MRIINSKGAFTLVEIMIVVTIIGIVAAIAIPNFVKSSDTAKKNACLANIASIRNAEDMYALDTNAMVGTTPLKSALAPTYIRTWPKCGSTEYEVPAIGSDAICPTLPDVHTLSVAAPAGGDSTPPPVLSPPPAPSPPPSVPIPRVPFRPTLVDTR